MSLGPFTRDTLQRLEARPSKKLGQNFLVHEATVAEIIDLVDPQNADQIVEIGGGLGVLSRPLAARAGRLIVFEVDRALKPYLEREFAAQPQVTILGDALTEWATAAALLDATRPVKVVGNIPYQITGPLLGKIFANTLGAGWSTCTLMVQKEVATRMLAKPGDTERGGLSVAVEFHALPGNRVQVSREAFYPKPNVDSTVVQLRPRPVPLLEDAQIPRFEALVERGFHMRRKTIWNNLRDTLSNEEAERLKGYLEANGVNLSLRPQDLDLRMWLKAFWVVEELASEGPSLAKPRPPR